MQVLYDASDILRNGPALSMDLFEAPSLQKKSQTNRVPWNNQREKKRRISTTVYAVQYLNELFGDLDYFLKALTELVSCNQYEIPPAIDSMLETKEKVMKKLKRDAKEFTPTLIRVGRLSKASFELFRKKITYLPCYKTTSTYWNSQEKVHEDDLVVIDDASVFKKIENGSRKLYTHPSGTSLPFIPVRTMFSWILYLFSSLINNGGRKLTVRIDFALWGDGGKLFGAGSGLFGALKLLDISLFKFNEETEVDEYVPFEFNDIKWLISTSWTCRILNDGENMKSVRALDLDLVSECIDMEESPTQLEYGGYSLIPKLVGWTTDHGYRSKGIGKDSNLLRCGECGFHFACADLAFLDFDVMLRTNEVTPQNWKLHRQTNSTSVIDKITGKDISILSYDNHHNFCGLVHSIFDLFYSMLSTEKRSIVKSRLEEYSGISTKKSKKTPSKDKRDSFPAKGWMWRIASIYFRDIFDSCFNEEYQNELNKLFVLLTEIHLVNYTHFDRRADNFDNLIVRYWFVLAGFCSQLKILLDHYQLDQDTLKIINNVYLHKVLLHSPRLFMKYNLAVFSCEQGEGSISQSNRIMQNGVYQSFSQSVMKLFDVHTLKQDGKLYNMFSDREAASVVWKSCDYVLCHLTFKRFGCFQLLYNYLNNSDDKPEYFRKKYPLPTLKRRDRQSWIKLNAIVAYVNQMTRMSASISLGGENTQYTKFTFDIPTIDTRVEASRVDAVTKAVSVYNNHLKSVRIHKAAFNRSWTLLADNGRAQWKDISETCSALKDSLPGIFRTQEPDLSVGATYTDLLSSVIQSTRNSFDETQPSYSRERCLLTLVDHYGLNSFLEMEKECLEFLYCISCDIRAREVETLESSVLSWFADLKVLILRFETVLDFSKSQLNRVVDAYSIHSRASHFAQKKYEHLKNRLSNLPELFEPITYTGQRVPQNTEPLMETLRILPSTDTVTPGRKRRKPFNASSGVLSKDSVVQTRKVRRLASGNGSTS